MGYRLTRWRSPLSVLFYVLRKDVFVNRRGTEGAEGGRKGGNM
ncbi:MAG TPA: hypothetical protein VK211_16995 [Kamptonema sp.]|nr:hypothetical protein [Kamptonema sp.]